MSDFDEWNILKKKLNNKEHVPLTREGEFWWCHLGRNIGIEENGKNKGFSRPVLIIKKHNNKHCLVIPTTSQRKFGRFYMHLKLNDTDNYLMLSQIKTIDTKRLYDLICEISEDKLSEIKKAVHEINFQ